MHTVNCGSSNLAHRRVAEQIRSLGKQREIMLHYKTRDGLPIGALHSSQVQKLPASKLKRHQTIKCPLYEALKTATY